MNWKAIVLLFVGLGMVTLAYAQKKRTFYVPKAGTLVELLTEEEANRITSLTLQGKINAVDFRHLRDEFTSLRELDISNAIISMYAGKGGTKSDKFYVYPANSIPAFAFCRQVNDSTWTGKETLRRIVLSDKTRSIEEAAFKGCDNLKICQIRRKKAPGLLPEALGDSLTAVFVPLGSGDAYRTSERWDDFAILEGEPLVVKVQIGKMESLASVLLREGIQPKEVNFLSIEGKMDEADFKLLRDYMPYLVSVDMAKCNATVIPDYTFTQKKYLLNIVLPSGLKTIGQRAFSGCVRLAGTLVLPSEVSAIEFGAFMGCERLRQVKVMGQEITTLGDNLFGDGPGKLVY